MFKKLIIIISFFSLLQSISNSESRNYKGGNDKENLSVVREMFYRAVESEASLDSLDSYLNNGNSEKDPDMSAVLLAGAAESLKAKYTFWPFSKLSFLKTGVKIMSEAVDKSPDNLEIRFLRFSVLHHVPGFLGFGGFLNADAAKIVDLLTRDPRPHTDKKLRENVADFMLQSGRLSPGQTKELTNYYADSEAK